MVAPLKVGLAGLGTVGASVIRLIADGNTLAARCGRPVEIVAVTARSKGKDRGVDLSKFRWIDNPISLANDPEIDVFVELMGGEGDPAKSAIEAALRAKKSVVTHFVLASLIKYAVLGLKLKAFPSFRAKHFTALGESGATLQVSDAPPMAIGMKALGPSGSEAGKTSVADGNVSLLGAKSLAGPASTGGLASEGLAVSAGGTAASALIVSAVELGVD